MTEVQNPKQLVFDVIGVLDIGIWDLFVVWCLSFDISGLSGPGSSPTYPTAAKKSRNPRGYSTQQRTQHAPCMSSFINILSESPAPIQPDSHFPSEDRSQVRLSEVNITTLI